MVAQAHAESEFEKYRILQDRLFESDFDKEIKNIEQDIVASHSYESGELEINEGVKN